MLFDIHHKQDEETFVVASNLTREESLQLIEDRILTGQMTGKKFRKVSLNKYRSFDNRATLEITPCQ